MSARNGRSEVPAGVFSVVTARALSEFWEGRTRWGGGRAETQTGAPWGAEPEARPTACAKGGAPGAPPI